MDREDLRNWVVFAVLAFGILGFYQVFVYGPQEAQRRAAVRAESAAQVQVHGVMARGWGQRRNQDKVHDIAQDDRQQGLEKISEHRWFRHRGGPHSFSTCFEGTVLLPFPWNSRSLGCALRSVTPIAILRSG